MGNKCFSCNLQLGDNAIKKDGELFCSNTCVDNFKESKESTTVHNGDVFPRLLRCKQSDGEQYNSEICLCFYKNDDGSYNKTFGVYQKLEQMNPSWSDTSEDPIRTPVFWMYASSLDSLVNR